MVTVAMVTVSTQFAGTDQNPIPMVNDSIANHLADAVGVGPLATRREGS